MIEEDVHLSLDVNEANKSESNQLNLEMAKSIYQRIMLNTKLDLTLHFPSLGFVARSKIVFVTASNVLNWFNGLPTLAETLETIATSGKFPNKSLDPQALWGIIRKFQIHLFVNADDPASKAQKLPIVDAMHGAIHYKEHTYWRFCSKWLRVSSDNLANTQHKFRRLLEVHLMSESDPGYLSHKFPKPTAANDNGITQSPTIGSTTGTGGSTPREVRHYRSRRPGTTWRIDTTTPTQTNRVGWLPTKLWPTIFDLLRYDKDQRQVWIYHVKRKFGQSTRDATSQLALSAKLIHDDITGRGEKMTHKHYAQLVEKVENREKLNAWGIVNENEYLNLFRDNTLTFVYAFVDENNKSTKRSLIEESQIKETVRIEDIKEKLECYKAQIDDPTNFKSIIRLLYRHVFDSEETDFDPEDIQQIADNLFQFLLDAELIEPKGRVSGKLLYGINFNQLGSISPAVIKFQESVQNFSTKLNFFEMVLKPYRSLYQTLIAKIELQRVCRFILERSFRFQICEIAQESSCGSVPATPVAKVSAKRSAVGSSSTKKKQRTSSKKKEVPKGQPLINEAFRKDPSRAARQLRL